MLHIFRSPDIRRGFNLNGKFAIVVNRILHGGGAPRRRIEVYSRSWLSAYQIELTLWFNPSFGRQFHFYLVKIPNRRKEV